MGLSGPSTRPHLKKPAATVKEDFAAGLLKMKFGEHAKYVTKN